MSIRYSLGQSIAQNQRSILAARPAPWHRMTSGKSSQVNIGFAVTASATSNTKNSWVQVFASTTAATSLFRMYTQNPYSGTLMNGMLIDIGVGAAGSESVVVPNLAIGCFNGIIDLPVSIPSGSRVAVRVQWSGSTSYTFYPTVWLYEPSLFSMTPTTLDVLGTSTSNSLGTALSGASGTWTQIVASTTKDYQTCFAIPSTASNGTFTQNYPGSFFHLGIGAAGSEVALASMYPYINNGAIGNAVFTNHMPYGTGPVTAGSRFAVQPNVSATNAAAMAACIVGVPYV